MGDKYKIGEAAEFKQDITATDSSGNPVTFKKGDRAWHGADGKMHTLQNVNVVGGFETDGDVDVIGAADYLMRKTFGNYDLDSSVMGRIYTSLVSGLSDIFLSANKEDLE